MAGWLFDLFLLACLYQGLFCYVGCDEFPVTYPLFSYSSHDIYSFQGCNCWGDLCLCFQDLLRVQTSWGNDAAVNVKQTAGLQKFQVLQQWSEVDGSWGCLTSVSGLSDFRVIAIHGICSWKPRAELGTLALATSILQHFTLAFRGCLLPCGKLNSGFWGLVIFLCANVIRVAVLNNRSLL